MALNKNDCVYIYLAEGCMEESMKVKILSHETMPHSKGSLYTVDPIWFKLARPRTNFYRGEKED